MNGIGAFGLMVGCLLAGVLLDLPRWSAPLDFASSERLSADFSANPLLSGFRAIGQSDGWDPKRRQLIVGREGWNSATFSVRPGECVQLLVERPEAQQSDVAVEARRLTYVLTGYRSRGALEVFSESGEFMEGELRHWHSKLIRLPESPDHAGSRWTMEVALRSSADLPVRVDRVKVTASVLPDSLDRR
jgi:hypothetical protein